MNKTILDRQYALARAHGPKWATDRGSLFKAMAVFAVIMLAPLAMGVCPCTMFDLAALISVSAAALLVGNHAITALAEEREKKTLVFLRLTLLSAPQVLLIKLIPEAIILRAILLICAPVVLATAAASSGVMSGLVVVAFTALSGLFAGVSALVLSTFFPGSSKAVVGGWIYKAAWLLLTPVMDMVLAAVCVQNTWPPVFSSLNPLIAVAAFRVPEAFASEAQRMVPVFFLFAVPLVSAVLFSLAARRFDAGFIVGQVIGDEQAHPVYQQGWGPGWLQKSIPALKENAMFLREMAGQMRLGAGRWPGYAVFVVLFLAPFLYARMWSEQDVPQVDPPQRAVVVGASQAVQGPQQQVGNVELEAHGVRYRLLGHTDTLCVRLMLNELCDVPLPADQLQKQVVTYHNDVGPGSGLVPVDSTYEPVSSDDPVASSHPAPIQPLDEPATETQTASLNLGLTGAVVLLLLYLGIRCSGFLAGAVTGERDRRAWEDLALTSLRPSEAFGGKVTGALLMPLFQMTLTFPLMLFFVVNGTMTVAEVGTLYVYAVLIAIASGLLGLCASAYAATSHEAHARALGIGAFAWVLLPLMFGSHAAIVAIPLLALGIGKAAQKHGNEAIGWAGMGLMLLVNPAAISPLTAVLSFMPSLQHAGGALAWFGTGNQDPMAAFITASVFVLSASFLCWTSTVQRLSERGGEDEGLRTRFEAA
ncbi:MAG: hypothetical protein ACYCW6_02750 [Candidatus Xenobia bacterium]